MAWKGPSSLRSSFCDLETQGSPTVKGEDTLRCAENLVWGQASQEVLTAAWGCHFDSKQWASSLCWVMQAHSQAPDEVPALQEFMAW